MLSFLVIYVAVYTKGILKKLCFKYVYIYIYIRIKYCIYFTFIVIIVGIQPLDRFGERAELSQATGMALVRCILGKFLGVVCHCFPHLYSNKINSSSWV